MRAKAKPQHRICSRCQGWFVLQGIPLYNQQYHHGTALCPQCAGNPENPDRYMLAERMDMREVERIGRAIMLGEARGNALDKAAGDSLYLS